MASVSLYAMSVLYMFAGISHFIIPAMYQRIVPKWMPWHSEIVWISGVIEIVLGLLLLFPATRVYASWGVIALLILVFPANIQMMLNYMKMNHPYTWITILRLPLQLVLIWWAYQFTR